MHDDDGDNDGGDDGDDVDGSGDGGDGGGDGDNDGEHHLHLHLHLNLHLHHHVHLHTRRHTHPDGGDDNDDNDGDGVFDTEDGEHDPLVQHEDEVELLEKAKRQAYALLKSLWVRGGAGTRAVEGGGGDDGEARRLRARRGEAGDADVAMAEGDGAGVCASSMGEMAGLMAAIDDVDMDEGDEEVDKVVAEVLELLTKKVVKWSEFSGKPKSRPHFFEA